jgi:uncharacterized protein (TIGR02466 family)
MTDIIDREQLTLFPTVVSKGKVDNDKLLEKLKTAITNLKIKDAGSFSYEREQFESYDNLHEEPEFKELSDLVLQASGELLDQQNLIRESHYITNMWATSTNKNFFHPLHNHPNCYLSGILYVSAPENCGKLVFRDPRLNHSILQYDYKEYNQYNSNRHYIKPAKGVILFWPHWLEHMVDRHNEKYDGKEDRMMIAFNIMVKTNINIKTAKLRI